MSIKIFCDGGARGNPGPAAWAFIVFDDKNQIIAQKNEKMGISTNNVAEYTAALKAVEWLSTFNFYNEKDKPPDKAEVFLDSKLVVSQLNGIYKVRDSKMHDLIFKVRQAEGAFGGEIIYHFIPREENTKADVLVNQALDSK